MTWPRRKLAVTWPRKKRTKSRREYDEHHHERHELALGAADADAAEVGPVDLRLLACERPSGEGTLRVGRLLAKLLDRVTEVIGLPLVATFPDHAEDAACRDVREPFERLGDERDVGIDPRRPLRDLATRARCGRARGSRPSDGRRSRARSCPHATSPRGRACRIFASSSFEITSSSSARAPPTGAGAPPGLPHGSTDPGTRPLRAPRLRPPRELSRSERALFSPLGRRSGTVMRYGSCWITPSSSPLALASGVARAPHDPLRYRRSASRCFSRRLASEQELEQYRWPRSQLRQIRATPGTVRSRRPCRRPTPRSRPEGLEWRCGDGHTGPAQPMRGGRGDSLAVRQNGLGGLRGSSSLRGRMSTRSGAPVTRPRHPARQGPRRDVASEGDGGEGDRRSVERLQEGETAVTRADAPESRAS